MRIAVRPRPFQPLSGASAAAASSRSIRRLSHHASGPLAPKDAVSSTWQPLPQIGVSSVDHFRAHAFQPALPHHLPASTFMPAAEKWFLPTTPPALNAAYLEPYGDTMLPMELTTSPTTTGPEAGSSAGIQFARTEAPLSLFLAYAKLAGAESETTGTKTEPESESGSESGSSSKLQHGMYIAQAPLARLSSSLRADVPEPELVRSAGRGDVYDSSLWLGLAHAARTPLHRDPNPNLLVQLAGHKLVRLLPPECGHRVLSAARASLASARNGSSSSSSVGGAEMGTMRGEEMMGPEGRALDDIVWHSGRGKSALVDHHLLDGGLEVRLRPGDAVFIPAGWWHAIRAAGQGINASVNWWFR